MDAPVKRYIIPGHAEKAEERIKNLIRGMDEQELSWVKEVLEEKNKEHSRSAN